MKMRQYYSALFLNVKTVHHKNNSLLSDEMKEYYSNNVSV